MKELEKLLCALSKEDLKSIVRNSNLSFSDIAMIASLNRLRRINKLNEKITLGEVEYPQIKKELNKLLYEFKLFNKMRGGEENDKKRDSIVN